MLLIVFALFLPFAIRVLVQHFLHILYKGTIFANQDKLDGFCRLFGVQITLFPCNASTYLFCGKKFL